jgi:PAS domain S-box-containing protein
VNGVARESNLLNLFEPSELEPREPPEPLNLLNCDPMNSSGYLFLGLTAIVAGLSAVLAYAVLRIFAAARAATRDRKEGAETAFMAAAMEDAVKKLKAGERAMQARAEASERLSGEIVASLTSGLLVVDADGIIRTLNPAGRTMLGLSEAESEGPFREVLKTARPLADVLDECLRTSRPVVRRAVPLTNGIASHLGLTVSPIREDNSNASHGVICLFTDLSEVVELEEQLRLKDSLARLGEMTAGIAHEFRNGLATIHGYSRLLELERLVPEFRPYVQGIRDETEALGQVVTNFLSFARPTELVLTPVEMSALAERAADDIRSDARARGGEVVVRGEFGWVEGDEVLLRQALSNLCRNAFEACDNARVVPKIVIEGHRDQAHGVLRISVSDNGPGIPADVAPRVFRPFFTTKAQGIGLGLALVQKIIVTHNGRVTVVSEDGGGARFVVTLPAVAGQSTASVNRGDAVSALPIGNPVRSFGDPTR